LQFLSENCFKGALHKSLSFCRTMPPLATSETATRGVHAHGPYAHAPLQELFITKEHQPHKSFVSVIMSSEVIKL